MERVLCCLDHRAGSALAVFRAMLPKQSDAYRAHEPRVTDFSPEAARRAMLEVRRWKEGKFQQTAAGGQSAAGTGFVTAIKVSICK